MEFSWGSERSTYHTTMVRRVHSYLKKQCTRANYEQKTVEGRQTDALSYIDNGKFKTWFLCEIKVNPSDLLKAVSQIHDTAFRWRKTHIGDTVIPVIAFPARLEKKLKDTDKWDSQCDLCKKSDVAIWIIEQSTVREFQGYKTTKAKSAAAKPARAKVTKAKSATAKDTTRKTAAVKTTPKKAIIKKATARKPATAKTKPKTAAIKKTPTRKTVARKSSSKK